MCHRAQGGVIVVPSAIVPTKPARMATYSSAGVVAVLTSWIGLLAGTTTASRGPSDDQAADPRLRALYL